ncbi:MAG: hypothetical protein Q7T80_08890 [Methanoregula sp.]|nr:hypothetical protein [Methanoregula sp.]
MLNETAEDNMRPIIEDYVKKKSHGHCDARLKKAAELYSIMGMGRIKPTGNVDSGKVTLIRFPGDLGWFKKGGNHAKPINYFTRGFIAAMFAAVFDKPARSYVVTETDVIMTGKAVCLFTVAKR